MTAGTSPQVQAVPGDSLLSDNRQFRLKCDAVLFQPKLTRTGSECICKKNARSVDSAIGLTGAFGWMAEKRSPEVDRIDCLPYNLTWNERYREFSTMAKIYNKLVRDRIPEK